MLTKGQIKLINSLSQKKYRMQHQLFVVEGIKGIQEFLDSNFELFELYATKSVFDVSYHLISEAELGKISTLKNPNVGLALFKIPIPKPYTDSGLVVALDAIRDPGNLGTIIRLCDWFGVSNLICSTNTVDCYNSKVVQATMGSLTRVTISYLNLVEYLEGSALKKFGAFMNGDNLYSQKLPSSGIIVLGNEANGISESVENLIDQKIGIPRFGEFRATESLNVATATAILLSEFNRGSIEK